MESTYEVFREDPEGPVWIESVPGLVRTNERLAKLNETNPAEYFLYSAASTDCRTSKLIDAGDGRGNGLVFVSSMRLKMEKNYGLVKEDATGIRIPIETVEQAQLKNRLMKVTL